MGWIKVSDDFYDDDKMFAAGSIGRDLYWHGMAFCNRNLTDGLIPRGRALALVDFTGAAVLVGMGGVDGQDCAPIAVERLLEAGLWHEQGHDCPTCVQPGPRHYIVHNYLKYQPSRAQVEAKAKANRERVEAWREAQKNGNAERNGVGNALHTDSVTQHVQPTPNPTPNPSISLVTSGGGVTEVDAREPRPHCSKHPEENSETNCRACMRRRKWDEKHAELAAADELQRKRDEKAAATAALRDCQLCDEEGWVLGSDGKPAEPAVKCKAHHQEEAHA